MNTTMLKINKWQEVLANQELNEDMHQLLSEVYMHLGDHEYEMNRLKVKVLTYEGYLEGIGQGNLIIDELYMNDKH